MEKEYHILLHFTQGEWSGTLCDSEGETSFRGIPTLLELLKIDPCPQLKELWKMARTDFLTGLLNRRGVEEEVNAALRGGKAQTALLLLDVDDLKRINDSWGHLKGDLALQKVAQVLIHTVGPGELAGRISGDEFVVIVQGIEDEAQLQKKGEQICQTIAAEGGEIGLSVSVGACRWQEDRGYEWLLERADRALYQMKRNGKRGFVLYEAGRLKVDGDQK